MEKEEKKGLKENSTKKKKQKKVNMEKKCMKFSGEW